MLQKTILLAACVFACPADATEPRVLSDFQVLGYIVADLNKADSHGNLPERKWSSDDPDLLIELVDLNDDDQMDAIVQTRGRDTGSCGTHGCGTLIYVQKQGQVIKSSGGFIWPPNSIAVLSKKCNGFKVLRTTFRDDAREWCWNGKAYASSDEAMPTSEGGQRAWP